jgi:hypothetical protein
MLALLIELKNYRQLKIIQRQKSLFKKIVLVLFFSSLICFVLYYFMYRAHFLCQTFTVSTLAASIGSVL